MLPSSLPCPEFHGQGVAVFVTVSTLLAKGLVKRGLEGHMERKHMTLCLYSFLTRHFQLSAWNTFWCTASSLAILVQLFWDKPHPRALFKKVLREARSENHWSNAKQ